jgi:hypothetical protein
MIIGIVYRTVGINFGIKDVTVMGSIFNGFGVL